MPNHFLERASASDWSYCGGPGSCAKCNLRFRREVIEPIERLHGELSPDFAGMRFPDFLKLREWREHLASELLTLPLDEFWRLRYWEDHLRMAFHFLRDLEQEAAILRRWLTEFGDDVDFADTVVFYLLRPRHLGTDVAAAWIERAISLAEASHHESLVESLLWTLGRRASMDPRLAPLAAAMGTHSPKIRRALNETSA